MVAAILTILGYSTNDKVVVYDRVRENLRKYKTMPLRDLIDLSINETLNRTLGTSMTVFLASLPLALFGGQLDLGLRLGDAVRHRRRHLIVDLHCGTHPVVPGRKPAATGSRSGDRAQGQDGIHVVIEPPPPADRRERACGGQGGARR